MARRTRSEIGHADAERIEDIEARISGTAPSDGHGGGGGNDDASGADDSAGEDEATEASALRLELDDLEAPAVELPAVSSPAPDRRSKRGGKRPGAGRKPASSPNVGGPRSPAPRTAPTLDANAAAVLLAMAEGGLMMAVGPRAQMAPFERSMIEPPLGRMLRRMTPEVAVKVAALADPLMLGIGILVYASRVFTAGRQSGAQDGATASAPTVSAATGTRSPGSGAPSQPSPARSPNGTAGVTHVAPGVRAVPNDLHSALGGSI